MLLLSRQFEAFIAVAEELHFGRAAQRLHISQPPLSQQLRVFEERIGVPLLERSTRSVRLTPAGESLRDAARRIVADAEDALALAQRIGAGESGMLRIGFTSTAAYRLIPAVIPAYRERYPDMLLSMHEADSAALQAALLTGRLDVALIRHGDNAPPADLRYRIVDQEALVAALPPRHPLSRQAFVSLQQLADTDLIGFEQSSSPYFHRLLDELFLRNGLTPRYAMRSLLPTILTLVASGIGATVVPASVTDLRGKDVQYRPIEAELTLPSTLYVAHRHDTLNAAVAPFIAILADKGSLGRSPQEKR